MSISKYWAFVSVYVYKYIGALFDLANKENLYYNWLKFTKIWSKIPDSSSNKVSKLQEIITNRAWYAFTGSPFQLRKDAIIIIFHLPHHAPTTNALRWRRSDQLVVI